MVQIHDPSQHYGQNSIRISKTGRMVIIKLIYLHIYIISINLLIYLAYITILTLILCNMLLETFLRELLLELLLRERINPNSREDKP